jgi:hypothetical protein
MPILKVYCADAESWLTLQRIAKAIDCEPMTDDESGIRYCWTCAYDRVLAGVHDCDNYRDCPGVKLWAQINCITEEGMPVRYLPIKPCPGWLQGLDR